MVKKLISIVLSLMMLVTALVPVGAYAASNLNVTFIDEITGEILGTASVTKGQCTPKAMIPAFPKGSNGSEFIDSEDGKNHYSYSWDADPETTPIVAHTVFTRLTHTDKHDYDFSKPQFKFQENSKSGLMAFYECSKCGCIGEVGVEITGFNSTGMGIKIDASAIGGNGIVYEHELSLSDLKSVISAMQKIGVPIPGWVNTVIAVADVLDDVVGTIVEKTSTCSKEGHLYGETPVYLWSENKATCIAKFECTRSDCKSNYDGHYYEKAMNVSGPVYTQPTCTENGEEIYSATVKFQRGNDLDIEDFSTTSKSVWKYRLGHSYKKVSNNDATCFEDGTYYQLCSVCGTRTIDLPDTGSQLTHLAGRTIRENEVSPSCTSAGSYNAVTYCVYCNTKLSDEFVTTDKLNHTPKAAEKENFIDSTCEEDPDNAEVGLGSYDLVVRCADCNEILSSEHVVIPRKAHKTRLIIEGATDATCTNGGSYTQKEVCVECNKVIKAYDVTIPANGHQTEYIVIKEPTCTEKGKRDLVCKVCGIKIQSEDIDSLGGHKLVEDVSAKTEPTCASKGEKVYRCSNPGCEYIQTEEIEKTANHIWDNAEGVVTDSATCLKQGTRVKTCTVCGYEDSTPIPKVEHHNYVSNVVNPTCTTAGYTTHKCTICNSEYTDLLVSAKGHKNGIVQKQNEKAATCAEEGSYDLVEFCDDCHEEIRRTHVIISKKNHNCNKYIVKATCSSPGYTKYVCKNEACNHYEYVSDFTEKLEHTPDKAVKENVVNANCITKGSYDSVVYCTVCKEELSREKVIGEYGEHTPEIIVGYPSTCTENGLTDGSKCSVCQTILEAQQTIDKKEHTPGEPVNENVINADCRTKGSYDEVIYCSECNEELSRERKEGEYGEHNLIKIPGKAATCTENGLTDGYKCTICNNTVTKQDIINAKGHQWDEGVIIKQPTVTEKGEKLYTCKVCKATKTESINPLSVKEATPTDSQADKAAVNNSIEKPRNIRTFSYFNKKRLLIQFDEVKGAQNYRVMYRKAGTSKWNYAWTDGATEYYLKNLKKGALYEFMFAAYKKNSKNEWERGAYSVTSFRYYKKIKIKKVKAGKKSATIKWTKDNKGNGYELFYSTKPDMSGRKRIVIKNKKKTSYTIKKLKKGKKYYFRVRSIKMSNGKKYTGEFSSKKKVKVK